MKKALYLLIVSFLTLTVQSQDIKKEWTRNYDESKIPAYTLPDPLLCENGHVVTSAEEWEKYRRPELLDIVKTYMYGHAPVLEHPLEYKVEIVDANFQGKYTKKNITLYLTDKNEEGPLTHAELVIPNNAKGPVPLFMIFGWGFMNQMYPSELFLEHGYGVAILNTFEAAPDKKESFTDGLISAYYNEKQVYRRPNEWGSLAAWAWEASRLMDYFQNDTQVDAKKVAVLGISRLGKAALWAAAQDRRFAVVFPVNSGCGGGALSRRMIGETVWSMNNEFPHWTCDNFQQFSLREQYMPFDQHSVIALCAPRPIYLATAVEDTWGDPKGEFLAGKGAEPVYALYGLAGIGCEDQPAVDNAMDKGYIAYHVRSGGHGAMPYDWNQFIKFADRFLK